jgi:hypothetical protein
MAAAAAAGAGGGRGGAGGSAPLQAVLSFISEYVVPRSQAVHPVSAMGVHAELSPVPAMQVPQATREAKKAKSVSIGAT